MITKLIYISIFALQLFVSGSSPIVTEVTAIQPVAVAPRWVCDRQGNCRQIGCTERPLPWEHESPYGAGTISWIG